MKQKLISHKGSVLIIAMIFMFALLVLVVVLINNIVADTHFQSGETNETQALYLAESGISKAIYYLNNTAPDGSTNASWTTGTYPGGTPNNSSAACSGPNPCQEPLTLTGGTYSYTSFPTANPVVGTYTIWVNPVTSGEYDGDIQIVSQGSFYGAVRTVQEMVTLTKTSSLAGWWPFDEGSGATANDLSGNGNNGAEANSPSYVSGQVGPYALSFNGSNQDVDIGQPSSLNFERTNSFSISAWIKTTGNAESITGKMENGSGYAGYDLEVYGGSGALTFYLINSYPSNSIAVQAATPVNDGAWHLVTATYNGSSNASGVTLYIDGEVSSPSILYNSLSASILNSQDVRIGSRNGGEEFNGSIDDVRIYNTVLTASQVLELYTHSSLKAWWKLTDGSGSSAADSSGFGNTGTLNNAPGWTQGIVTSHALSFNGTNQYVNTALPTTATDNITISLWAYWNDSSGNEIIAYNGATGGTGYGPMTSGGACNAGNKISILLGGVSCDTLSGHGATLVNDAWTYIAIERSSGTWKSYVNGALNYSGSSTAPNAPSTGFLIGSGSGSGFFHGIIDDTRIYNTALSADEISAIYAGSNPGINISVVNGSWKECLPTGC